MAERRALLTGGLVVAVLAVVVVPVVTGLVGRHDTGSASTDIPLGSAPVVRTNVAERQQVPGTLGYRGTESVVAMRSGVLTAIAQPGTVVRPGQEVAEIDGRPVLLMRGARPAWRALALGVPDGPDVRQLEKQLRAMGYDPAHDMVVDDHFTSTTRAAVRRWQAATHQPVTGVVPLGAVAFLPESLRVTGDAAPLGSIVGPGQPLVTGTTTAHEVTVALDTAQQTLVSVGDSVVVTLPDGTTTVRGRVTYVSHVATSATGGDLGGGGQGSGQGAGPPSGQGQPTLQVTVALADQRAAGRLDQAPVQVAVTDRLAAHVLAVPVTALLARAGGGYAVTIAGTQRDVPVTLGLFDDLTQLVQVSGSGLAAGMRVVVPAG